MELDGSEKRIQALFSELSLEDQSSVPQFGHLWMRAQTKRESDAAVVGRPKTVLISVLVTAVACSLAVWSWYELAETPSENIAILLPQATFEAGKALTLQPGEVVPVALQPEKAQPRRQKKTAHQRQINRKLAIEAALLSSWQSPTQRYMESPTGLVLSSLPQLNQSVKDLESFLPKNNEIIKESNR